MTKQNCLQEAVVPGCLLKRNLKPKEERKTPQKPCVLRSTLHYPRLYLQKNKLVSGP